MRQPKKKTVKNNSYSQYTQHTQTFMQAVENFIVGKYGKIENHWEGQLDCKRL